MNTEGRGKGESVIDYIDEDKCDGCGICFISCPMDVLRVDGEKEIAVIRYRDDCMTCFNCEEDCPRGAIIVGPERAAWVRLPW